MPNIIFFSAKFNIGIDICIRDGRKGVETLRTSNSLH